MVNVCHLRDVHMAQFRMDGILDVSRMALHLLIKYIFQGIIHVKMCSDLQRSSEFVKHLPIPL